MTFWTLPTAIEVAIIVLCLVIGVRGFRLRLRSAAVALVLLCPVPLVYLVASDNSAVFASDVLGVACLLWLALSPKQLQAVFADRIAHLPVALASLLLVVIPSVSTLLGLVATGQGNWKLIVLGLLRDSGYFGLFCAAIRFRNRAEEINQMIALQCIAFSLICCCGILQNLTGVDLTLAGASDTLTGYLASDSAAGFMGLYRGAVGAWGAAMLGLIPLVLFRRSFGWLIAPACMLAVLSGILLTGSRQGLVIGLIAAVIGTMGALAASQRGASVGIRAILAVAALALGGLFILGVSANTSYDTWINARFGSLLDSASIVDQAADRDSKIWPAIDRWYGNPLSVQMLGAGRGRLSQDTSDGQRDIVYVDSELVWQLQESGLVIIVTYLFFLIALARRFRRATRTKDASHTTMLAAKVALITGICLTYGHFFLLHVQTAQAPVAFWNWALFGTAIGVAIRAKRGGRVQFALSHLNRPLTARPQDGNLLPLCRH
jgi:hypothetical protein